jgi:hypothetical protein
MLPASAPSALGPEKKPLFLQLSYLTLLLLGTLLLHYAGLGLSVPT